MFCSITCIGYKSFPVSKVVLTFLFIFPFNFLTACGLFSLISLSAHLSLFSINLMGKIYIPHWKCKGGKSLQYVGQVISLPLLQIKFTQVNQIFVLFSILLTTINYYSQDTEAKEVCSYIIQHSSVMASVILNHFFSFSAQSWLSVKWAAA